MNFTAKVLNTLPRRFSNGEQQFSKVQIRFRQDDFAYPVFHAIEFEIPDSPDGWPIHFDLSERASASLRDSARRLLWWELEGEVPSDYADEVMSHAKNFATKYWLLKKSAEPDLPEGAAPTERGDAV